MMSFDTTQHKGKNTTDSCTEMICGIAVQLIFAQEKNREVPGIVSDILKGAYLRGQAT